MAKKFCDLFCLSLTYLYLCTRNLVMSRLSAAGQRGNPVRDRSSARYCNCLFYAFAQKPLDNKVWEGANGGGKSQETCHLA